MKPFVIQVTQVTQTTAIKTTQQIAKGIGEALCHKSVTQAKPWNAYQSSLSPCNCKRDKVTLNPEVKNDVGVQTYADIVKKNVNVNLNKKQPAYKANATLNYKNVKLTHKCKTLRATPKCANKLKTTCKCTDSKSTIRSLSLIHI